MIRLLFVGLTLFIWLSVSFLQTKTLKEDEHKVSFLAFEAITAIATLGFFLSESLKVSFMFFEVMSLASAALVFHERSKDAMRAGISYLAYAIAGGMASLMGLFLYYAGDNHTTLASLLMLVGFGVKSGIFPLHTWLIRTYTASPYPATILLSSVLSKTGVFGIIMICAKVAPGNESFGSLLLVLGILTVFAGGIRGILACDIKRLLASSSMSQIGFIIVGAGAFCLLGNEGILPAAGCILYSVNHGIIKLVLFGVAEGVSKDSDGRFLKIRGALRGNRLIGALCILSMLSVMGLPGLNGYIGKTLIHEGLLECEGAIAAFIELLFTIGGGLTVCYMLRLYETLFLEETGKGHLAATRRDINRKKPPVVLVDLPKPFVAMLTISCVLMVVIGLMPQVAGFVVNETAGFFDISMPHHSLHFFSLEALLGAAKSIGIGVALFFLIRNHVREDILSGMRDIEDVLYAPLFTNYLPLIFAVIARFVSLIPEWILRLVRSIIFYRRKMEFSPNLNENFGSYVRDVKVQRIPRGVSYSLLLFIGGITAALLYLLISQMV